jgi:phenylalanyl-tRNA synthetase beta chain
LIEEIGRIVGYDKVPAVELPAFHKQPEVNPNFYAAELVREELMSQGFSEVFTSVFADKGERVVANKVDGVHPYLRDNLTDGLRDALKKNIPNKDLLGLKEVKLFEIGIVWQGGEEVLKVATIAEKKKGSEVTETLLAPVTSEMHEDLPLSMAERYQPFSKYPFIVRDIAMWVPSGTESEEILEVLRKNAGDLLVRSELFDRFEKDGKVSYAFRLVFQSFDRTLTDEDANMRMESVNAAVKEKGWEVR